MNSTIESVDSTRRARTTSPKSPPATRTPSPARPARASSSSCGRRGRRRRRPAPPQRAIGSHLWVFLSRVYPSSESVLRSRPGALDCAGASSSAGAPRTTARSDSKSPRDQEPPLPSGGGAGVRETLDTLATRGLSLLLTILILFAPIPSAIANNYHHIT